MESGFVIDRESELGFPVFGVAAGVAAKKFLGKEGAADKSKQQIQKDLKNMGYSQFTKMSGWKGNEKAKETAMKTIYQAVISYPNAGNSIIGWLEKGKVTPGTVAKVKSNYPPKSATTAPVTQAPKSPQTPAEGGGSPQSSANSSSPQIVPDAAGKGGGGINPLYLYGGGGLALIGLFLLLR